MHVFGARTDPGYKDLLQTLKVHNLDEPLSEISFVMPSSYHDVPCETAESDESDETDESSSAIGASSMLQYNATLQVGSDE